MMPRFAAATGRSRAGTTAPAPRIGRGPLLLVAALLVVVAAGAAPRANARECRFSSQYQDDDLVPGSRALGLFLDEVMFREGLFAGTDGVGLDAKTGMTLDGHRLSLETGEPSLEPHPYSAPSKESLHIALLAKALAGHDLAIKFFAATLPPDATRAAVADHVLNVLERKVATVERFGADYPGFGGYLPWFIPQPDGSLVPTPDFADRVPSLDNGQYAWAVLALVPALRRTAAQGNSRAAALAGRWDRVLGTMKRNAVRVFYAGDGRHRTVAVVSDVRKQPEDVRYTSPSPCGTPCYLDDPYEGELFVSFADLFGAWPSEADREQVWKNKQSHLQRVEFRPQHGAPQGITVVRGWWFSAHEVWKFLLAPYSTIPVAWALFQNGERARTRYSAERNVPGLYASVTGPAYSDNEPTPYFSDCGIAPISFNNVTHPDVITPYAAFPLFLAFPGSSAGPVWYKRMLDGPKGQNVYGSTESMTTRGDGVAPLVTWDSKVTTVLAMAGGVGSDLARAALAPHELQRFQDVITRFYEASGFDRPLDGTREPVALPTAAIPHAMGDFPNCRAPRPKAAARLLGDSELML